jgi:hypothetical protein
MKSFGHTTRSRMALAFVALLAASACATTQGDTAATGGPFEGPAWSEGVLLTVENNDFRDATIDVYWNGMRTRAGIVTGKTTETFELRWRSEWARIGVDFLGSGGFETEPVPVEPGDHLNFTIMVSS